MANNKRKEGWYWVKTKRITNWQPRYYNGTDWVGYLYTDDDSFFYSINERRIPTPDEPSVLIKAIELINDKVTSFEYRKGINMCISILEQLKSEI